MRKIKKSITDKVKTRGYEKNKKSQNKKICIEE